MLVPIDFWMVADPCRVLVLCSMIYKGTVNDFSQRKNVERKGRHVWLKFEAKPRLCSFGLHVFNVTLHHHIMGSINALSPVGITNKLSSRSSASGKIPRDGASAKFCSVEIQSTLGQIWCSVNSDTIRCRH